jgi:hypothetical protein
VWATGLGDELAEAVAAGPEPYGAAGATSWLTGIGLESLDLDTVCGII